MVFCGRGCFIVQIEGRDLGMTTPKTSPGDVFRVAVMLEHPTVSSPCCGSNSSPAAQPGHPSLSHSTINVLVQKVSLSFLCSAENRSVLERGVFVGLVFLP